MIDSKLDARTRLRQLEATDAVALCALIERNRERLSRRMTWVERCTSPDDSRRFVEAANKLQQSNGAPTAAICVDNQLVGIISLHRINWDLRLGLFGYWLDEAYEGQGLVSRCALAMIDFAFNELGLGQLEIVCAPDNLASLAIARKLGFNRQAKTQIAIWQNDPTAQMVVHVLKRNGRS